VSCNPIYEQIGAILRTFAHAKRQDRASDRGKHHLNSGIAIGFSVNLNHEKEIFFGMHKAPEFIQLTTGDMQLIPKMQNDQSTVRGRPPIQPITNCIFVGLQDLTVAGKELLWPVPAWRCQNSAHRSPKRFPVHFRTHDQQILCSCGYANISAQTISSSKMGNTKLFKDLSVDCELEIPIDSYHSIDLPE